MDFFLILKFPLAEFFAQNLALKWDLKGNDRENFCGQRQGMFQRAEKNEGSMWEKNNLDQLEGSNFTGRAKNVLDRNGKKKNTQALQFKNASNGV